jgi:hypothetical protein
MNPSYYTIKPQQYYQGTNYSSWEPQAGVNNGILKDAGIHSNWDYRKYIQKNAHQIMKYNTMEAIYDSGNNPYTVVNTNSIEKSPMLYNSLHDEKHPAYGFRNSDLKQAFTTKQRLAAQMVSPSISTRNF